MQRLQTWTLVVIAIGGLVCGCGPADEREKPSNAETGDSGQPAPAADVVPSETEPSARVPEIEAGLWQLEALLVESGEMEPPLAETRVDVLFSEGELSGSTSCNRFFGSYSLDEDKQITISEEIGSTQMACPPPVSQQERLYLSLLGRAAQWSVETGSLVLRDDEGEALLAYGPAQPIAVEGPTWQATGINNGKGGVVSTGSTHLATASFAEGKVSGSGGCNQFHASYEIDEAQISIGPAMSTRKACAEPEGIMDQEQQYFQALERAKTFQLGVGKLELRDENGSLQVGFKTEQ